MRSDAVRWDDDALIRFWHDTISPLGLSPEEHEEQAAECTELGAGYTFSFDRYTIDMAWYWDGDGSLLFSIYDPDNTLLRTLSNNDCKKDYRWVDPQFESEPLSV